MNSVSFLFYLADVIQNIKPVAAFLSIVTFVAIIIPIAISCFGEMVERKVYKKLVGDNWVEIGYDEWKEQNETPYSLRTVKVDLRNEQEYVRYMPKAIRWTWLTVPLALVMMVFANALPSRETIFMIATSEFVEDFSQTETGTEIGALAKDTLDYLKNELAKLKGE